MEIDSLDFFLISSIYNSKGKDVSTWRMGIEFYQIPEKNGIKEDNNKIKDAIERANEKIKERMKKMERWGIVIIEKETDDDTHRIKNVYNLIKENVNIGKNKFKNKTCNSLQLKIDNRWCAYELTKD